MTRRPLFAQSGTPLPAAKICTLYQSLLFSRITNPDRNNIYFSLLSLPTVVPTHQFFQKNKPIQFINHRTYRQIPPWNLHQITNIRMTYGSPKVHLFVQSKLISVQTIRHCSSRSVRKEFGLITCKPYLSTVHRILLS